MLIDLAYGRHGLAVELPDDAVVLRPSRQKGAHDARALVREALAEPLGVSRLSETVRRGQKVAIAVCDGTRAQPREAMVLALLDELAGCVDERDVVVLVATGTHRPNSALELEAMLGASVLSRVEVVNHDARAEDGLVHLASVGAGVPVVINRRFVEADVRITTGFVEPHFFAGFSGGPKLVAPGLAGLETILRLHDAAHIGDEHASFGVTEGNPVHDDVRAVAALVGVDLACDVIMNDDREVVACFAGELFAMHAAACRASKALAMAPVEGRFDVVVTTNAGFPLDQNLYQAVKGMAAAARVVKPGGLIVLAAACEDGLPSNGGYAALISSKESPAELLEAIAARATTELDQWQVQVQARVQALARVALYSEGITVREATAAHLEPIEDIAACVAEELARVGAGASCCVLPQGPETIPFIADAPTVPAPVGHA